MSEHEINDGNKLIAEFMSGVTVEKYWNNASWDIPNMDGIQHVLYYHSSWDWLMPVIDKIEDIDDSELHYKWDDQGVERANFMGYEFFLSREFSSVYLTLQLDPAETVAGGHNKIYPTRIEGAWRAVVEFIKWHNIE